ncbi:MAG: hypothetical protein AAFN70_18940 [Planctomycetota bacterium]
MSQFLPRCHANKTQAFGSKRLAFEKKLCENCEMAAATPRENKCLVCGKSTTKPRGSRGLCSIHYRRFKAKLDAFPTEAEREAFEQQCLDDGWILPKSKGGRPKEDDDPFGAIAAKIAAQVPGVRQISQEEEAAADAAAERSEEVRDEVKREAKKAATKEAVTGGAKKKVSKKRKSG